MTLGSSPHIALGCMCRLTGHMSLVLVQRLLRTRMIAEVEKSRFERHHFRNEGAKQPHNVIKSTSTNGYYIITQSIPDSDERSIHLRS